MLTVFMSLIIWTGFEQLYKRVFNFLFPPKDLRNLCLASNKYGAVLGYIVNGSVIVCVNGPE